MIASEPVVPNLLLYLYHTWLPITSLFTCCSFRLRPTFSPVAGNMAASRASTSAVTLEDWDALAPLDERAKASLAALTDASNEKPLPKRVRPATIMHLSHLSDYSVHSSRTCSSPKLRWLQPRPLLRALALRRIPRILRTSSGGLLPVWTCSMAPQPLPLPRTHRGHEVQLSNVYSSARRSSLTEVTIGSNQPRP